MKQAKTETGSELALPSTEPERSTPAETSMLAVIERAALNKDVDVDKMERLLAMQERLFARQAETAFNNDMRNAQEEMPQILRDAKNPSTNSAYTRLESLLKQITPIYSKYGFSLSFGTGDTTLAEHYRITCVVSHRGGHSRNYQADLPIDYMGMKGSPNKTKTHGFGSTMSYGRRYLTLLIFNIALTNEDNDGNAGDQKKPEGPSSLQPADARLRALVTELWELLAPVRGTMKNWDAANQWLWREEILDAAASESMPRLSEARLKEVIIKVKAKGQLR